jgi:hypothetical protein
MGDIWYILKKLFIIKRLFVNSLSALSIKRMIVNITGGIYFDIFELCRFSNGYTLLDLSRPFQTQNPPKFSSFCMFFLLCNLTKLG